MQFVGAYVIAGVIAGALVPLIMANPTYAPAFIIPVILSIAAVIAEACD